MAWNENTVVLSFRGTASFSNVLTDLSVSFLVLVPNQPSSFYSACDALRDTASFSNGVQYPQNEGRR